MIIDKQRPDKRKISFFIFAGFALLIMLSFFSINNVYADRVDTSDIDDDFRPVPLNIGSNHINPNPNGNSYFPAGNIDNPSPGINLGPRPGPGLSPGPGPGLGPVPDPSPENPNDYHNDSTNFKPNLPILPPVNSDSFTDDGKNTLVSYLNNKDQLEKTDGKVSVVLRVDSNGLNYIITYYDPNSEDNNENDIGGYLNLDLIFITSTLDFKGNGFDNFKNIIKKIANINFNKLDNDEYISIIQDFQSGSYVTLTIIFFTKIFMDFHNNGKEHLNSF